MNVEIITPPVADETDQLDHGLVTLTEAICQATGEESSFGLGGRFGYGENFENDVFVMRRFYWGECTCNFGGAEDKWYDDHKEAQDHKNPSYVACWQEFEKLYSGHADACATQLPNFRHKRTGLEVRWYKWIGRDTESKNSGGVNLQTVFSECMESLRTNPKQTTVKP